VAIAITMSATLLFSGSALAQEPVEEMSFEELINEAKTAYEDADYERAVDLLLAANRRQPNARLLLNVAKSHEKAGNCVEAMVYYRAFIRDPEAEQNLVPAAEKALERSDECEGWDDLLSGRLTVLSTPLGATVTVDDEEIGMTPLEVAGLMEGRREITVTLEGYESHRESVDLKPDTDATVSVTLEELPEEPEVVAEPEPEPQPEPEPESSGSNVVHYAIAGGIGALGAGLFTVGLITDLGIPDKYDEPRRDPGISASEFDRLTEERSAASTRALIFYVAGSALIAGGIGYGAYAALAGGDTEEESPQLVVSPAFGPRAAGFVLSGEF
jgi:hypothetical protein